MSKILSNFFEWQDMIGVFFTILVALMYLWQLAARPKPIAAGQCEQRGSDLNSKT